MKCSICGAESGRSYICRKCSKKRKKSPYLYELKSSLVTHNEMEYLECIRSVLPKGYLVQPQANLASFITRTDDARYQGELFRNVDFIITDSDYRPIVLIEINDRSHLSEDRRERDEKVTQICEEAGISIITLWTSYGVNREYIRKRILEAIHDFPPKRVIHFGKKKKGCYIATYVYGSYDCPQVWTLRRFRDQYLDTVWYGRAFIRFYYAVSPVLVKYLGKSAAFRWICQRPLDAWIRLLQKTGLEDTPYQDT